MRKIVLTESEMEAKLLMRSSVMGDTTRDPHYERDYIINLAKRLQEEMNEQEEI